MAESDKTSLASADRSDRRRQCGSRRPIKARGFEPGRQSTQPAIARIAKGPWRDNAVRYIDDRAPVKRRPITKAATDLLVDYLKRQAFRDAIDDGASIEFAGEVFLGVAKVLRQSDCA